MKSKKPIRVYLYTAFALIMLIMSWESNLASAALMNPTIPDQSIRIRILANSDRVEDQWIKKEIRDAITANVNGWNLSSEQIEDARNEVNRRLPELNKLVGALLAKYDFTYGYEVELSKVHFPSKIFGRVTYPSGEYEALRVTLGEGKGQNWWCVLFPPLCFGSAVKAVDENTVEVDGEEKAKEKQEKKAKEKDKQEKKEQEQQKEQGKEQERGQEQEEEQEQEQEQGKEKEKEKEEKKAELGNQEGEEGSGSARASDNSSSSEDRIYQAPVQDGDDVEVKFFLWEVAKKVGGFFKNLFS